MSSDSEASEGGFESASEGASPISPSRKQEPDSSFAAPNQSTESATVVDQNQQQQKENPQQQPSGGWGWGSWLSSAVSAVTESLQSDVDSLVSTAKDLGGGLKKITVDSIDRVYETLDAPDAPLKREANGAEQIPQVDSSDSNANNNSEGNGGAGITAGTQQTRTVGGIPTSAILQSTEGVLGAIDRTLDFTSDLLGNAVLGGYRTIEAANLGDKIGRLKVNVEQSEVVSQSKEVGENLLAHGLTALEAIGSVIGMQAAQSLAETRRQTPANLNSSGVLSASRLRQKKTAPSLADYFEDNCGQAHLQALEMLAAESAIKVRSFDEKAHDSCREAFAELERQFDLDDMLEEVMECEESALLTEAGYQRAADRLHTIGVSNRLQLDKLRQAIKELTGAGAEEKKATWALELTAALTEESDPKLIKSKYPDRLQSLIQTALQSLADLSEKSCEQLLRVSEIILMRTAEFKLESAAADSNNNQSIFILNSTAKDLSGALRELVLMLLTELQFSAYSWTRLSNEMLAELKRQLASSPSFADDLREIVEDEAGQRLKDFSGRVDKNLSAAMSFVQEAMQSNLPIIKLLLLTMSTTIANGAKDKQAAEADDDDDDEQTAKDVEDKQVAAAADDEQAASGNDKKSKRKKNKKR